MRDAVSLNEWEPVSEKEAMPRGATPLFDALGRLISLAEGADKKRAAVIVMTDGHENSSRELKKSDAEKLIKRCKEREWQVVFLGADFDNFDQANSVGVAVGQTMKMDKGNYRGATVALATATAAYASTGKSVEFTDEDRKKASGAA